MSLSTQRTSVESNATPTTVQTAKYVAAVLVKYAAPGGTSPDGVRIHCQKLLVSKNNRGGQPLNLPYLHEGLIDSVLTHGFDPTKPPVGIAVQLTPEGILEVVQYNKDSYGGLPLYPPVEEKEVEYATLADSHLNTGFRCFRAKLRTSKGRQCVVTNDSDLQHVLDFGWKWIVITSDCPKEDQIIVSEWRNQDQNRNLLRTEMELIKAIETVCLKESSVANEAAVGNIARRVNEMSVTKENVATLVSLSEYVMRVGPGSQAVNMLTFFHAMTVNGRMLAVPASLFENVGKVCGQAAPLLGTAILMACYSSGEWIQSARQPFSINFLTL